MKQTSKRKLKMIKKHTGRQIISIANANGIILFEQKIKIKKKNKELLLPM